MKNCRIGASAVIDGWTEIGDENEIFPMASIGLIPKDLKFGGEPTRLVIGNRNVIREFVTIHRGTAGGGGITRIGDRNLFMAYAHVAHDCFIGDHVIVSNAVNMGGHVTIGEWAIVGGLTAIHQFVRVGPHAFVGGAARVQKDVPPYVKAAGSPLALYGLNSVGLQRRGFSEETRRELKRA